MSSSSISPSASATAMTTSPPPPTATATSATYSLTDAVAAVSTAKPTIPTRPRQLSTKSKPRSVKWKMPPLTDKGQQRGNIQHSGESSLPDRSHFTSSFSAVNGMLKRRNSASTRSSSGVKQEVSQDTFAESVHELSSENATRTLTFDQERASGSESEEIDIDIENDDGDENAILQSRSASPSSVYNRLLQQANVAESTPHIVQDQAPSLEEEGEPRDLHIVVNNSEDVSNDAIESDDCGMQNSDMALSSSGSGHKAEVSASRVWGEESDVSEEKLLEPQEVKHISKLFYASAFFLSLFWGGGGVVEFVLLTLRG